MRNSNYFKGKTKETIDRMNSEFQEACKDLVRVEVLACASQLISELFSNDKYIDELVPVMSQELFECTECGETFNSIEDFEEHRKENHKQYECQVCFDMFTDMDKALDHLKQEHLNILRIAIKEGTGIEKEIAEVESDEEPSTITREALEHWIVSDWLADRLEEKGEMILKDFLGLNIWGRSTSGQAISIDNVIEEIVIDMNLK